MFTLNHTNRYYLPIGRLIHKAGQDVFRLRAGGKSSLSENYQNPREMVIQFYFWAKGLQTNRATTG